MDMENVAGPLRAALAEKGYEQLTPVQEAVLAEELIGRDLLVSAQTGSGKTVAFGLAMAPEVLGGIDRLLPAEAPVALVIAPTRELALQVRSEFEWLYADAGATIASCVGGMDYRAERRALERGAHLVVGTPGRLRDHVERGSLDLSALRAVVLDEADEMLDMGFSEDLEFLLGSAPEDRRVLMFSATVPKEIAKLAATYQRDARRLEVKSEAKQHADIEYRAINVSSRDKEPAIFNLLRWYDARVAIVFAKTRANVNHLHARMVNRGFPVVALSGELSQSERMHALQALRDGRARVCIATDVAARGIDLPGLDLVIHADLPTNPETLLHSSGRTGRAGRKGVSVLVVPQPEVRKASRLLDNAKLTAEWGKAPGAEELQEREDERLMADPSLTEAPGDEAAFAAELLEAHGADALAAAFVRLWRSGRSAPEELGESLPPPAPLPPREKGEFGPSVWFRLSVGHNGRAEARWLLPKICDAGGIAKDGIGAIRVQQDQTFVQIAEQLAGRFGKMLEIEPDLMMERLDEAPDLAARPARAPREGKPPFKSDRPRRDDKPAYQPRAPREEDGERRSAPRRDFDDARPPRHDAPRREERGERPAKAPFRAAGSKSHGGSPDRPARASGYKSHAAEGAGPRRRDEGGYSPRSEGETRKPYAAKGAESRPFARRDGDAGKPEGAKPWAKKSEGKSWGDKGDAPRGAGKPAGAKPYGKSAGDKPYGAKPYGAKPAAGDKPYGKKPATARPAAKFDPSDTSKRFAPPRKPKG